MTTLHLIYFDAGGGHRSAANALNHVIAQQKRPWQVTLVNLQELLDPIDPLRRWTGKRTQDLYNASLQRGYTLGWPTLTRAMQGAIRLSHKRQVQLLREWWSRHPCDLAVSLIPNFNRAIGESLAALGIPMLTVLTDLADYPPRFWIEPQEGCIVCGTPEAAQQARAIGLRPDQILRSSGMILHPRFYEAQSFDRRAARATLGLEPDRSTGLVMFGGHGSVDMVEIVEQLERAAADTQLILICGHNEPLADKLRALPTRMRKHVEGFARDIPRFMAMADYFVGKPGPGSLSEALHMGLPVIVERNAWTLPQERFNTDWVRDHGYGIVLKDFDDIAEAVHILEDPLRYTGFRSRVASYRNQAVFEIPELISGLLQAQATGRAA